MGTRMYGTVTLLVVAVALATVGTSLRPPPVHARPSPEPCVPHPSTDDEPPCNPNLADTVWAANHRNSYAQASSPAPGFSGAYNVLDRENRATGGGMVALGLLMVGVAAAGRGRR